MVFYRAIKCILLNILFLDLCLFCVCGAVEEGEPCSVGGTIGNCTALSNCHSALDSIDNGRSPQFCDSGSEANFNALVCCHDPEQERQELKERISFKMCKKYYPELFAPEGEQLPKTQVVAGKKPSAKQFPHTAMIGYHDDEGNTEILCLGSLISEKFVLTAAHCGNSLRGLPAVVRLGALDISSTADDADPQNFTVIKSITHPEYDPIYKHDIALLELDRVAKFTDYVKPICLYQSNILPSVNYATAVGWGNTNFAAKPKRLQEISLVLVNNSKCNDIYKTTSSSPQKRIMNDKHICAGGNDGMGTCWGDGGGPLQIRKAESLNSRISFESDVYDLIGITSFGKSCGLHGIPDVYTRVSFYLDWIEKIVWP